MPILDASGEPLVSGSLSGRQGDVESLAWKAADCWPPEFLGPRSPGLCAIVRPSVFDEVNVKWALIKRPVERPPSAC